MRVLLICVVIVLILAVVGWIRFSDSPDRSTVTIEKEAIRQDTAEIVERGNEFLDNAKQAVKPTDAATEATEPAPSDDPQVVPRTANPDVPRSPSPSPGTL